ncbi:hybrid sensor histidine kinase/response regulator [Rhodoferax koreense]|uniref:Chemotaxis protein CheA n=1 Tax=Rhodoferax koreensis TaxID=1842727 RepID=A0A1P8JSP8_9BURK|nr:Hpt domain-containing protein [Rhodoferax koreense]APW36794.1 hybrid sensor histidine kinase/response regulator [Rhodoferax koreense]
MNAFLPDPPATAADLPDQDLGPLAWVLDELRKTLDGAVKALRRYTREAESAHEAGFAPPDTAHLRMARQQLHMALGAMEMVGLAQPALVLRGMEQAANRFVEQPETCSEDATAKIERASFALIDYLEGVLAGKALSPVGLFPQYRDVQGLVGGAQAHPADLWPMEAPSAAVGGLVPMAPLAYGPPVRTRLDQAVLKTVKTGDPAAAQELGLISLGLAAAQTAPPARAFWTLSAAYFEGLGQGLFPADLYAKRIASRVLTQYAALAKGETAITRRLVQDMLFFCAQAVPAQDAEVPTLAAVRKAYNLQRHTPVDYETRRFGRFDPALLAQARKRLAAATETWSALAGGDTHRFKTAHDQFALVGESLTRLHPESAVLAQALTQAVEVTVRSNAAPPAALGMEVATSVLYLEAAYEELDQANVHMAERAQLLAGRLQRVMRGGQPEPLDPWMEELYHRVSDRQTMGSVVDELRSSLGDVEQTLDQFFRTPREKVPLAKVANQLSQMRGVLSVLGLEQASHAVMRMRESVDRFITDDLSDAAERGQRFDRLGNSLGALGFLIDMLAYQPTLAKKLFVYDEDAGEFRLVMGRTASHHVEEEAEPASHLAAAVPEPTEPLGAHGPENAESPEGHFPALDGVAAADAPEPVASPAVWQPELVSEPLPLLAEAASAAESLAAPIEPPLPDIAPTTEDAVLGHADPTVGATALDAPVEDGNEDDDELRDIFLDEAREVVQTGLAAVQELHGEATAASAQTSLRRAFHTLKGSARMVGLNEFGEAGWAMEQLLNSWLAEQAPATPALLTLAEDALRGLSLWVEDIAVDAAQGWRAEPFRTAADALRLERRSVPLALPMGLAGGAEVAALEQPAAAPQETPVEAMHVQADAEEVEAPPIVEPVLEPAPEPEPEAHPEAHAEEAVAPEAELTAEPDFEETVQEIPQTVEEAAPAAAEPGFEHLDFDIDFGDLAGVADANAEAVVDVEVEAEADAAPALPPDDLMEPPPVEFADQARFDAADELEIADELAAFESSEEPDEVHLVAGLDALQPEPAEVPPLAEPAEPGEAVPLAIEPAPLDFAEQLAFDEAQASGGPGEVPTPQPAPEPGPEPEPVPEPTPEPPAPPIEEPTPVPVPIGEPEPESDAVKVIGTLRIGIPLYNVYLNEADEWSRRLLTELNEWSLELHQPLPDSTVALAHSLAGSSATVGFHALSQMARALEDGLSHVQMEAAGTAEHARVFTDAAEDIRRLLHQFAAGFLKEPNPAVLQALRDVLEAAQAVPAPEQAEADVEAHAPPAPVFDGEGPSPAPLPEAAVEMSGAGAQRVDAPPVARAAAYADRFDDFDDELDVVDAIDADLFTIFEEEASELLPQLGGALRQWRARPENAGARNEVLRALHTLKGSARLAGALRLGELAHRLETAIERLGSDAPQPAQIEPLLSHFDVLQAELDALRAVHLPGASGSAVVLPLNEATAVEPEPVIQLPTARAPVEPAAQRPLAPPRQMANQSVRVRSQLLDRLVNQAGEVIITRTRLEARLDQLRGSLTDLTGNLERLRQQLREIELQAESQMQSRLALVKDSAQGFDPLEFDRFTRVQELTRMMAESVNDVATVQRNLQRTVEGTEDDLVAQARQARALQRDLLRTRMVEFEGIAERLYGVVRQASKDTGKQIKLDITGGSIEMDRGVLDRMSPAFEHLLRNAIAHGIETPEARTAAGKPAAGTIRIGLHHEGNDISVTFGDDGAGLDLDRIRAKAHEQGLLAPGQELGATEIADLIFTPGFSTADQVTEIAGRGIGMDVVRAEVQALGGRIETTTQAGQGTQFKMVLPLTTAVTQVVMLRTGALSIGVPANLIEVVRRTPQAELDAAYQSQSVDFGGETVPFFWAGVLLQSSARSTEPSGRHSPVVVFRSAAQRLALHVDEVLGNQEVVVKNLGPQLSRLPGLSGMSVLASGAVVLIYNPVALATVYGTQAREWLASHDGAAGGDGAAASGAPAAVQQVPLVLVVDDSITVRRVTQRLLKREGYRVSLAADGLQALERLREERPALVLSDIEMPRMDGFDLARNIRGDEAMKDLPIVMISSRTAEKHREHAKSLGVNHYLGKPYPEEELLSLVRRYAAQAVEV